MFTVSKKVAGSCITLQPPFFAADFQDFRKG